MTETFGFVRDTIGAVPHQRLRVASLRANGERWQREMEKAQMENWFGAVGPHALRHGSTGYGLPDSPRGVEPSQRYQAVVHLGDFAGVLHPTDGEANLSENTTTGRGQIGQGPTGVPQHRTGGDFPSNLIESLQEEVSAWATSPTLPDVAAASGDMSTAELFPRAGVDASGCWPPSAQLSPLLGRDGIRRMRAGEGGDQVGPSGAQLQQGPVVVGRALYGLVVSDHFQPSATAFASLPSMSSAALAPQAAVETGAAVAQTADHFASAGPLRLGRAMFQALGEGPARVQIRVHAEAKGDGSISVWIGLDARILEQLSPSGAWIGVARQRAAGEGMRLGRLVVNGRLVNPLAQSRISISSFSGDGNGY